MEKIITNKKGEKFIILFDDEDIDVYTKNKYFITINKNYRRVESLEKHQNKLIHKKLHREIISKYYSIKYLEIDHINNNPLDNRKCNLRIANRRQQAMNTTKRKNVTSIFKGVSKCKTTNRWKVQICSNSKRYWLGRYDDEIEAAKVYDAKAIELFGEFACLNFKN